MPRGNAVNEYITVPSEHFATVWTAAQCVREGGWQWGVDLKHAHFNVPTSPMSWKHSGVRWKGAYLVFLKLSFGLRNAPSCFHRFSGAIKRMALKRGAHTLVCMLDDFWGYAPTKERALKDMWCFISLLTELGISPKWEKVVLPCKDQKFLGVIIDIAEMLLRLDADN